MALNAAKVKAISRAGRYSAGGVPGLYLVVRSSGSKSWVQRIVVDGRRRDMGLGAYPEISLKQARERAAENRTAVAYGRNPLAVKDGPAVPTFREVAERTIEANGPRWRHPKTAANWKASLERYAFPIFGAVRVDRVKRSDVLTVLVPIWATKPAIARKLRQRIRAVMALAMAHGYLEYNPAGEVIDAALPPMPQVREHFRSLPHQEVGTALRVVDASNATLIAKLCFKYLVLTAARSGEARGASWEEIDIHSKTWTIPGTRMKSGVEHRVPLADASVEVLEMSLPFLDDTGLVFPSLNRLGKQLSNMTLTKILRSTGLANRATVHGFRTSFKTWCMEETDIPWAVGEAALAHSLGNSTEQAYARTDLFERRRGLMQRWADYVCR